MEYFFSIDTFIALSTLTFLEIVLGIDNLIFITIAANKLPQKNQAKALNIGLVLAMVFRILLLLSISWIYKLNTPLFTIKFFGTEGSFTGQSLILIAGGIFLIYKSTNEIHHKLEGESADQEIMIAKSKKVSLKSIIFQIALINVVFSFDSILTAIGLIPPVESDWIVKPHIVVMIIAVVFSVIVMLAFAGPVGKFINKHPTVQMLGLSFLILIGFMLIAEGMHLAHFIKGAIPKGYLYFTIFFSIFVEMINIRLRSKTKPVKLKTELENIEINKVDTEK